MTVDIEALPAAGQSLLSGCTADLSDGEISRSDDDNDLPSVKKILAHAKRVQPQTWPPESVINLAGESDDNDTAVSLHRKHPGSSVSHKANALPPIGYF